MHGLTFWTTALATTFWLVSGAPALERGGSWIGTWATSPVELLTVTTISSYPIPPPVTIKGTIRYRLRVSLGGGQVRLKFLNQDGDAPLNIGGASVGLAGDAFDAKPGSLKRARFSGKEVITIPPHSIVRTDPVDIPVQSLGDLVVSVYVPDGITQSVWIPRNDSVVMDGNDATLREHLTVSRSLPIRPILSEVDVLSDSSPRVIVALGDSITDAFVDPESGDRGWPGALARRLQNHGIAVVNAGIGGNQLLKSEPMFGASALARLDRDVFSVPGVSHIVVLEGINDIGMNGPEGWFGATRLVEPQDIISAYSQIIARAHARGIKVFGVTLTPFEGAIEAGGYYSPAKEKVRAGVNNWIRTSKNFDGVIDLDRDVRDAANPRKLKPQYDIGDHLHPNAEGERHMGEAIDLRLFN